MLQVVEINTRGRRKSNKRRGNMVEGIKSIALNLFNQWGYRGTTVRDICNEIEITAPSLYYYFDSKELIFSSLLEDSAEFLTEHIKETMENCEETNAPERIKALFYGILEFNKKRPAHTLFIVKNRSFEEKGLDEVVASYTKKYGEELTKMITEFIKSSHKRRMPKSSINDIILAFDGFTTGYLLQLHQGLINDTPEQAEKSWEIFWYGIK